MSPGGMGALPGLRNWKQTPLFTRANAFQRARLARRSCVNAGYGADPPIPSICWPYEGSGPLSRAQEHLLQGLYTLLPSAGTVARIFGR